ncbi:unnamed protein product [Oppiella nova]|uniref:Uncharacterized protein n=1 Tax=Oppiella nova TaxID=334625 RepID=A0A7R9M9Q5_9ACAR|nr:unnamed protein product [Oppiella nova]CAG2173231.1 unnamed protein product [Oppiella nova]
MPLGPKCSAKHFVNMSRALLAIHTYGSKSGDTRDSALTPSAFCLESDSHFLTTDWILWSSLPVMTTFAPKDDNFRAIPSPIPEDEPKV